MAQSLSTNRYPYQSMTLTGEAHVTTTPDLAVIHLGVQTTGYDLSQIQSENAQVSQNIIDALKQAEVTEIKTIQYSIDKMYDYDDGTKIDKGYSVKHIFEIKTDDIEQIGNLIDIAVNMGANIVESISLELSDPELYYQQALNLAIDNAIEKAKSITTNLNIKLNPVPVRIVEGTASPIPMQQFQREAVTTPIVPGELTIEALVTTDFIYA